MVKFKAPKANYNLSVAGQLVRFGRDGTCLVKNEKVIEALSGLSHITRVDLPTKVKKDAKVSEDKAEMKKDSGDKPKKKSKKKKKE